MKIFPILFILLFIFSCKKENSDITVIGNRNGNFNIIKLNPEILISRSGEDSLDINSDGSFDIKFIRSPMPLTYGYGSVSYIIVKNGLQIALSNINKYPDALSIKTVIDGNLNWSTGESVKLVLQSYNCGMTGCLNIANFINVSDKYIGFKNGEKYGWIKVDNTIWDLKIKEYTVFK
jgi:hypothetical protein